MAGIPWRRAAVLVAVSTVLVSHGAAAQVRATLVASGFVQPIAFVQDPSQSDVQFVVEQTGHIRVLKAGAVQSADFLDLSASIVVGSEQGLLGLAFPPDYASSRRFYVNFTNPQGNTVVARFLRSVNDPLRADPSSRVD